MTEEWERKKLKKKWLTLIRKHDQSNEMTKAYTSVDTEHFSLFFKHTCSFPSVDHKHEPGVKNENHQAPYADINLGVKCRAAVISPHRSLSWRSLCKQRNTLLLKIRPHCSQCPEVTCSTACNINYSFSCELYILPFIQNVTMHWTFLKNVFLVHKRVLSFVQL